MRTIKAVVVFCLVVFAAWTVNAAEELENLVINPDFTEGQNGWAMFAGNAAATWAIQPKGGVGDDAHCAFVDVTATDGGNWYTPNLYTSGFVALEKNTEYTCTFWARTEEGEEKGITLTIQRGADPWTRFTQEAFAINGEWAEYSMTWNHPETLGNGWVMIHTPGSDARGVAKGKLWIDHVRVYRGEYQEDELSAGETIKAAEPAGKLATSWGHIKTQ